VHANPTRQRLTHREHEIALLIADSQKGDMIARRLGLAPQTVSTYAERITTRLGLTSRGDISGWVAVRRAPGYPAGQLRRGDVDRRF
jgi:DNA-binding CsgD family transcriptional regulator